VGKLVRGRRLGRVFRGLREVLVVRIGYPLHGLSEIDSWSGLVRLALLQVVLQMQSLRPRAFPRVCAGLLLGKAAQEVQTRFDPCLVNR